jgi:hypothetical protein
VSSASRREATYVEQLRTSPTAWVDSADFAGTWTQPQWRANGTIAWTYGDWAASLFIDWVGEHEELFLAPQMIKSYWRFNPQVAFSGYVRHHHHGWCA